MYSIKCERCGAEFPMEIPKENLMEINHMLMENPSAKTYTPFMCPECEKPQFVAWKEIIESHT